MTERILRFLSVDLRIDTTGIGCETELFSTGIIDSFALIDLVGFLERDAGVVFGPLDVTLENLDTVQRMVRFAERARV
jgi:acyl carrier protein